MRRTDRLIGAALERPIADILYLPYLGGERAPFSDPYARAAFIGMNRNAERADMCRAALEGSLMLMRTRLTRCCPNARKRLS
jgi:sugar (pentulose or hexulose) kinase